MIPTNATMQIGIQNRNPPYPSVMCRVRRDGQRPLRRCAPHPKVADRSNGSPDRRQEQRKYRDAAQPSLIGRPQPSGLVPHPHTSRAVSTTRRSSRTSSSNEILLPGAPLANPHCGLSASCSSGQKRAASSIRRLSASFVSIAPDLLVINPSTTILPGGTNRSGSNEPARGVSYSRKNPSTPTSLNSTSATGSYPPCASQLLAALPRQRWRHTTMSFGRLAIDALIRFA